MVQSCPIAQLTMIYMQMVGPVQWTIQGSSGSHVIVFKVHEFSVVQLKILPFTAMMRQKMNRIDTVCFSAM